MAQYMFKPVTDEDLDNMRVNLSSHPFKVSPEPTCDFCGLHPPVVMFAASRTTLGTDQICWRWSACSDCNYLIETGQWDKLKEYVAKFIETVYRLKGLPVTPDLCQNVVRNVFREFHHYVIREVA